MDPPSSNFTSCETILFAQLQCLISLMLHESHSCFCTWYSLPTTVWRHDCHACGMKDQTIAWADASISISRFNPPLSSSAAGGIWYIFLSRFTTNFSRFCEGLLECSQVNAPRLGSSRSWVRTWPFPRCMLYAFFNWMKLNFPFSSALRSEVSFSDGSTFLS